MDATVRIVDERTAQVLETADLHLIAAREEVQATRRDLRTLADTLEAPDRRDRLANAYLADTSFLVRDIVRREVEKGHQAYIVYPLVESSDKVDLRAATEEAEHLAGVIQELLDGKYYRYGRALAQAKGLKGALRLPGQLRRISREARVREGSGGGPPQG